MKGFIIISFLICGILFSFITFNPLFNILSFSGELDKDLVTSYGTIIGGLFGPILTLISFFLIYASFEEQRKFNKKQIAQNEKQMFLLKLDNDIKYFRDYTSTIKYRDPELAEDVSVTEEEMGELFFIKAKKQLDKLFEAIKSIKVFNDDDEKNIIGATFEIFYIGVGDNTLETLRFYLSKRTCLENIEKIINEIKKKKTNYNNKIVYYGGHQGKLGHYFRQLFNIIYTIDKCSIENIDKYEIAKSVKTKMSVYEQAILCYNSFTYLGGNWIDDKYIETYKLVSNIPKDLLPFNPRDHIKICYEYEQ